MVIMYDVEWSCFHVMWFIWKFQKSHAANRTCLVSCFDLLKLNTVHKKVWYKQKKNVYPLVINIETTDIWLGDPGVWNLQLLPGCALRRPYKLRSISRFEMMCSVWFTKPLFSKGFCWHPSYIVFIALITTLSVHSTSPNTNELTLD